MTTVHQFHSGSASGDAVTNSMLLIQQLLLSFGLESEIFVEHVAPELTDQIRLFTTYQPEEGDVLLIHHSMGHEQTEWILKLPVTKILVYHNITPPEFFPPESPFRHFSKIGREQLHDFLPQIKASIADSEINARELTACGYKNVSTIPLLVDISAIQQRISEPSILKERDNSFTILFVGRIAPNKCQDDLIDILSNLQHMSERPVRLVLVGGYESSEPYFLSIQEKIALACLDEQVVFTGKISDEELTAWYTVADVFVSMSEHEGFGVPLIEAMAFDVPVVAFKSTNVPFTMAGAGLLVSEKKPLKIATLLFILSKDRSLRRAIIKKQRQRVLELSRTKLSEALATFLQMHNICDPASSVADLEVRWEKIHYQIEGPFETSYSLALVNREVAFALNELAPLRVGLFATEGPGDYEPDLQAVQDVPGLSQLYDRGRKKSRADVVIRNLYPPRVADMDGLVNLLYFAWEESAVSAEYVADFNSFLDGMPVLSDFVKKVLIDNGVHLPIEASGCGFDHIKRTKIEPYQGKLPTGYKFLHISSCFPRKAVDVLLKSFCETFSRKDDVSLIIKTFPNIHNTIGQQADAMRQSKTDCPNIIIIEDDLPAGQVADLYRQCDAFVAPSRGEGFGLPMAEAMWYGLPVITTGFGGQTDFCTDQTSWLIDFSFEPAKTHLNILNSVWAEPDTVHLGHLMREVWSADGEHLQPRVQAAKKLLETTFTWKKCAERVISLENKILSKKPGGRKKIKLGWVSSWNVKCGIAMYSKFLLQELNDDDFEVVVLASSRGDFLSENADNVQVCWKTKNHDILQLLEVAEQAQLDIIVIQFNWAFYALADLAHLIVWAKQEKIVVVVMFHVTKDLPPPHGPASLQSIAHELKLADRLLVHGIDDLNRLKNWGLVENVALFPHGVSEHVKKESTSFRKTYAIAENDIVVASYGFLLSHKGIEKLIEAFSFLHEKNKQIVLLLLTALYPAPSPSKKIKERCMRLIREFDLVDSVIFETDYLADTESMALLSMADLVVFAYQNTDESSSAAVRAALSLGKPIAVTPLGIFQDVRDVTHLLPGTSAGSIAEGIDDLLFDPDRLLSKQSIQGRWLKQHSWTIVGERLGGMLKGLVENNEC